MGANVPLVQLKQPVDEASLKFQKLPATHGAHCELFTKCQPGKQRVQNID
jgi:hypothetical protein